jgi:hypothetical protein
MSAQRIRSAAGYGCDIYVARAYKDGRPGLGRGMDCVGQCVPQGLARSIKAQRNGFTATRKTNAFHTLNVFTGEEYESNGKSGKKWTKIGAAIPHKEGIGFSVELRAFHTMPRCGSNSSGCKVWTAKHPTGGCRQPIACLNSANR